VTQKNETQKTTSWKKDSIEDGVKITGEIGLEKRE